MKNIVIRIIRVLLFPFIYCHQIIMDAPIIGCDDEMVGYSHFCHQVVKETPHESRGCKPASVVRNGNWYFSARS